MIRFLAYKLASSSYKFANQAFDATSTYCTPVKKEHTLQEKREILTNVTVIGQNTAAGCSFGGYFFSGIHGTNRLRNQFVSPPPSGFAKASPLGDKALALAKIHYNLGTLIRSNTRRRTTDAEGREDEYAKEDARMSNIYSFISEAHSIAVFGGQISGGFYTPKTPVMLGFHHYSLGPAFNTSAWFGTRGARKNNDSEYKETNLLITKLATLYSHQEEIPYKVAEEIVRETVPHLTNEEHFWKNIAYGCFEIAAVGGLLGGGLPILKEHYAPTYNKLLKAFTTEALETTARLGGRVNGVFYVSWAFYAAIINYKKGECGIPKYREEEADRIHKYGIIDSAIATALTIAAMAALMKGKSAFTQLTGDVLLNKMDVFFGLFAGAYALTLASPEKDNPFTNSPLPESPFYGRSWFRGWLMGNIKDTITYMSKTDPSFSEERVEAFIQELDRELSVKKNISYVPQTQNNDTQTTPWKSTRQKLEETYYIKEMSANEVNADNNKQLVRRIVLSEADSDKARPYWAGANYSAKLRGKAEMWKAQNPDWKTRQFNLSSGHVLDGYDLDQSEPTSIPAIYTTEQQSYLRIPLSLVKGGKIEASAQRSSSPSQSRG